MSQKLRWGVAFIGVVLVGVGLLVGWMSRPSTLDVQGHRGARGLLPENTLPAFALAQELGVSTLELDTKVTADGQIVITHDSRLNPSIVRDSSGSWVTEPAAAVADLTLAQLQGYDVGRLKPGTPYAERFPEQKSIDGTRIPTLSSLFDQVAASGDSSIRFNIETKIEPDQPGLSPAPAEFARLLVDEVRSHGLEDRVSIQSFDWRTLTEVQRIAPEIPTVALTEADESLLDGAWTGGLRLSDFGGSVPWLVAASGADVWSPDMSVVTPDVVAEAHGLGLLVVPWTLSTADDIERMVNAGVDGIITDYPDRAVAAVGSPTAILGRWLAALLILLGVVALGVAVISGWRGAWKGDGQPSRTRQGG